MPHLYILQVLDVGNNPNFIQECDIIYGLVL
jgi:hypothetical protein